MCVRLCGSGEKDWLGVVCVCVRKRRREREEEEEEEEEERERERERLSPPPRPSTSSQSALPLALAPPTPTHASRLVLLPPHRSSPASIENQNEQQRTRRTQKGGERASSPLLVLFPPVPAMAFAASSFSGSRAFAQRAGVARGLTVSTTSSGLDARRKGGAFGARESSLWAPHTQRQSLLSRARADRFSPNPPNPTPRNRPAAPWAPS
jgi:hypothetical protein